MRCWEAPTSATRSSRRSPGARPQRSSRWRCFDLERGLPAQGKDLAPQLLLGFERRVDLMALAMPALHGEVELRCLQSREAQVSAESTLVQRAQPLAKPFPGVGEDVHLGRQHRACADGRLFALLPEPSSIKLAYRFVMYVIVAMKLTPSPTAAP